jgi:hypothetical protein
MAKTKKKAVKKEVKTVTRWIVYGVSDTQSMQGDEAYAKVLPNAYNTNRQAVKAMERAEREQEKSFDIECDGTDDCECPSCTLSDDANIHFDFYIDSVKVNI